MSNQEWQPQGAVDEGGMVPPAEAVGGPAPLRPAAPVLTLLLNRLVVLPDLQRALADCKRDLERGTTDEQAMDIALQVAALLNMQGAMLQAEQAKMARLLQQMNTRLDEIAGALLHEDTQRQAASDDSTDLNVRLQGEVRDIGTTVRQATSLSDVQRQVSSRIAQIGEHLQQFRERESARFKDYTERAERLRSRVSELEQETSQLQESVQREHQKATTDTLTGIPNRLAFEQRVGEELKRSRPSGEPLCIAIWDIDRFKSINDNYGHAAGDKVLRIVAQHLSRSMRKSDFLARYGGEEFVVVMRGLNVQEALSEADRVRESMVRLGLHFDGQAVNVTFSCGIATFATGDTLEAVLNRADRGLYRAKKAGRNQCFVGL